MDINERSAAAEIRRITPNDALGSYDRLKIDNWSDQYLVQAVADVLARPRVGPADSFVLHAPLELIARSRLLPFVTPARRRQARLHIVNLAVAYEHSGPALDVARNTGESAAEPLSELTGKLVRAIDDGDLDSTERAASDLALSENDPRSIVQHLATRLVARTGAAAHAPILLSYLAAAGPLAHALLPLLRPLARELARMPGEAITWFERPESEVQRGDQSTLDEILATAPRLGVPGSTFIHPVMMQVDRGGLAAAHLAALAKDDTGRDQTEEGRSILRTAARSMIQESSEYAPYGWTHCLTLPQAVLELRPFLDDPRRGTAIAATQVLAFRVAMGSIDLEHHAPLPAIPPHRWDRIEQLATGAACRHDAHIVKYALAVIDASLTDPQASGLYLRAGERLLETWDDNGGDPADSIES